MVLAQTQKYKSVEQVRKHRNKSTHLWSIRGFPGGSVLKNLPASAGVMSSIPMLGRSPRGGKGNTLQCSSLGNLLDREVWQPTVHGAANESDTTY